MSRVPAIALLCSSMPLVNTVAMRVAGRLAMAFGMLALMTAMTVATPIAVSALTIVLTATAA